jgi:Tol biopolymer transport system component
MLADHEEQTQDRWVPGPQDLRWSPDGTRLSYNIDRFDPQGIKTPTVELHILSVVGDQRGAEQMYEGVAGGGWSADGTRIGVVREAQAGQMGSGPEGIPAILEVETGGQLVLGSERMWQAEAPSFNHDGTLLMVHENTSSADGGTRRSGIVIYIADGEVRDRIDFSDDSSYYSSPEWSPVDDQIAMHISRRQGDAFTAQYEIYDLQTRAFFGAAKPPEYSDRIGGGCGGGDMWHTSWSMDGQRVLYSFSMGDTGTNGIWSWDLQDGVQRVLYAANASAPSAGPDGRVMFSAGSMIMHGSSEGGFPSVITDGYSPVWWVPE